MSAPTFKAEMLLESALTCPHCEHTKTEHMPADAIAVVMLQIHERR